MVRCSPFQGQTMSVNQHYRHQLVSAEGTSNCAFRFVATHCQPINIANLAVVIWRYLYGPFEGGTLQSKIVWPWRWTVHYLSKRRHLFAQRRGVTSRKTWLFSSIAMMTSGLECISHTTAGLPRVYYCMAFKRAIQCQQDNSVNRNWSRASLLLYGPFVGHTVPGK